MENENTKLITTNGLFYKIKLFFNNIFKKQKNESDEKNNENHIQKSDFKNEIIIKRDEEKQRLILLQQNLREHKITEKEITEEDIKKLNDLYDSQILELQNKIAQNRKVTENYKKDIIAIKKKLL